VSAASSSSTQRLPAGIWALGFVSLLMDVSSETIHSLLPLFREADIAPLALLALVGVRR